MRAQIRRLLCSLAVVGFALTTQTGCIVATEPGYSCYETNHDGDYDFLYDCYVCRVDKVSSGYSTRHYGSSCHYYRSDCFEYGIGALRVC